MSIKIVKGSYSSVVDSASLSGNQTLTLPNASGTVALTNQFATVATSGSYNDLSGKPSLAKVATSGSYNDLSNKPSIPSTPKGYITQTWRSGNNWYRVYSDGWIEQGGYKSDTYGLNKTLSFNRSFSTSQYSLTIGTYSPGRFDAGTIIAIAGRSTNSSSIHVGSGVASGGYFWEAKGY